MGNEHEKFSQRLAHAMQQAGYEPRPSVLFRLFNTNYRGRSVSVQTTSRWLNGQAIPAQDKLQVIADLLGVEPQALRFGTSARPRVAEPRPVWPVGVGSRERHVIDTFLQLPPKKREVVGELVKMLSGEA
jgi:transcriptional regulator with XRE-family HTH domain